MTAVAGDTKPAAGVIVARPATAPVSKPRNFGFFETRQSTSNNAMAANEAAMSVLMNANAVVELTRKSEPALKPYKPKQRYSVHNTTSGMLFSTWHTSY